MITVNVWPMKSLDDVGHASMTVKGGTHSGPDFYISWWPQGQGRRFKLGESMPIYCVKAFPDQDYATDFGWEGKREPNRTTLRDGILDERRIRDWWQAFRSGSTSDWCTLTSNCSTIVARALEAGGSKLWVDTPGNVVWNPNDVDGHARAISQAATSMTRVAYTPPAAAGEVAFAVEFPFGDTKIGVRWGDFLWTTRLVSQAAATFGTLSTLARGRGAVVRLSQTKAESVPVEIVTAGKVVKGPTHGCFVDGLWGELGFTEIRV